MEIIDKEGRAYIVEISMAPNIVVSSELSAEARRTHSRYVLCSTFCECVTYPPSKSGQNCFTDLINFLYMEVRPSKSDFFARSEFTFINYCAELCYKVAKKRYKLRKKKKK